MEYGSVTRRTRTPSAWAKASTKPRCVNDPEPSSVTLYARPGAALALRVEVVGLELAEGCGFVHTARGDTGSAAVHGDAGYVHQPGAGLARRGNRLAGPAHVDGKELFMRRLPRDDRGRVHNRPRAGGRDAPGVGVARVPFDRLGAQRDDRVAPAGMDQGAHRFPGGLEGQDHVAPHQAAAAGDEDRHAGSRRGRANGSSTTRASTPAARTRQPGVTSRRITPRPIHRPTSGAPGALSGSHVTLDTRPTSRSSWTTSGVAAPAGGGSSSNSSPRSWRLACPRKCRRLTVSCPV